MKNSTFLERASRLQKEYAELYNIRGARVIGMDRGYFQIPAKVFRECEREGLLEHISGKLQSDSLHLEAMTQDGVRVVALEDLDERKGK